MLLEKVKKTIKDKELIKKGDKIVVGVSGGPDSVCLLYALNKLKKSLKLKLIVAHVNYNLRGNDSLKDQKLVEKLAAQIKLKVVVKNILPRKKAKKENLEAALRNIRYKFFNSLLRKEKTQKIAIAHSADDQVVIFLMFLIRGAGLRGLSGVSYKTGNIIRPLLDCSRKEILDYVKINHLKFRKDITNEDLSYTRNRIRHELIPYLEKNFNPDFKALLQKNIALIRDDYEFIREAAVLSLPLLIKKTSKDKIELDLKKWMKIPPALQKEILRLLIEKTKGNLTDVSNIHLKEILNIIEFSEGKKYKSFWGLKIYKERGRIVVERRK